MMYWHGVDLRWAYADLLSSIYKQTYCKHSAYDILHDALVRFALTKNPNRATHPQAYLHTIVRNLVIDGYKERARLVPLIIEDGEDRQGSSSKLDFLDGHFSPSSEHLADIKQRLEIMQCVISKLPPRCKDVFWMYRIESMPQQEIAIELGITQNMVQRHVMRAMLDLLEARDLIL